MSIYNLKLLTLLTAIPLMKTCSWSLGFFINLQYDFLTFILDAPTHEDKCIVLLYHSFYLCCYFQLISTPKSPCKSMLLRILSITVYFPLHLTSKLHNITLGWINLYLPFLQPLSVTDLYPAGSFDSLPHCHNSIYFGLPANLRTNLSTFLSFNISHLTKVSISLLSSGILELGSYHLSFCISQPYSSSQIQHL